MAWYTGIRRGQWMALIAALLGWMFDGFEMGIFPMVGRSALIDLLDLKEEDQRVKELTNFLDDPQNSPDGLGENATAQDREALLKQRLDAEQQRSAIRANIDSEVGPRYGMITAAFLVGAAFGGWFFGWLGDRVGRVRALIFSVLTYALFTGACGLAQAPWQLGALRFIAALGMGGEWSLGVALVMEAWPSRSRPVLAGLIGAAANVGFFLTVVVNLTVEYAGVRTADGGWRWVLALASFPALLTFFIRMFVPESEKWIAASASSPKVSMFEIFRPNIRGRTIAGAMLAGLALIGTWGSVQWIVPWTGQMTNGDETSRYLAQTSSALGAVVGSFLGAWLGSRFPRRYGYIFLCLGSLMICQFLFRYYEGFEGAAGMPVTFFLSVALAGGMTASFYGWLPLYLPELFPTRIRATGQGFCFNFGRILAAFGALFGGVLMGKEGYFSGNFAQACATISLVYLLGVLIVWYAPETKGKPLPE